MKYILCFALASVLASCSFYTELTYRRDRREEYLKEDGFIISCQRDNFSFGEAVVVGTYTPASWSESFYYGYLQGKPSERKVRITDIHLLFLKTGDTLSLREIRKEREYLFTAPNAAEIIRKNKQLKLTVSLVDETTGKSENREYILKRKKHTYPTGTFPH